MIFITNLFQNDFKFIFPELFLFFFICSLIIFCVILGNSKVFKLPILVNTSIFLSLLGLVITFLLYVNLISFNTYLFNFQFESNSFIIFIKCLILFGGFCSLFYTTTFFKYEGLRSYEFVLLILLSLLGMLLLVSSYDFISIYLSLELQSLCLYILASYNKKSNFSTEAGLKYFILGALSSGLLLFGFSIFYGFSGITNLDDLILFCADTSSLGYLKNGISLGLIFVTSAFFFKLGSVPFHIWLPDVYEGVITIVTFFFALVPKIAMLGFISKFYLIILQNFSYFWIDLFLYGGIFSLLVGSFSALYQVRLKRLLAYSAIGNMGYFLLSLSCNSLLGFHGFLMYLVIYLSNLIGIFGLILSLREFNSNSLLVSIYDLRKLKESNFVLSLLFVVLFFSTAGIPPLAGFYGKFYVFLGLVDSSYYFLALIGVIFSVISCFYYIRLIRLIFFNSGFNVFFYRNLNIYSLMLIIYMVLFNLCFFLYPSVIFEYTYQITLSFFLV